MRIIYLQSSVVSLFPSAAQQKLPMHNSSPNPNNTHAKKKGKTGKAKETQKTTSTIMVICKERNGLHSSADEDMKQMFWRILLLLGEDSP